MIVKDYQFKACLPKTAGCSIIVLYFLHAKGNRDNATGDDDLEDEQNVP